ncbi:hypothetical protein D6C98_03190 [Aureobasidium pullulans]|uniref:U6 small nuclear RNA (adenine-(43)-N(6))-methyltransferase n=1 Tax=Aureobasidium pullulans TaxID=5580 RepID=A0A4S9ZA57_AURPU|nr:hypothetical protein D6D10_06479 [Aureobasidium pullulans]THY58139.1 hypothetical protein D6C98_03190 [Aureobasidium pullulans]TIA03840.1 hypothetical protein D6C82_01436 [Aureobasidium pullulans]
MTSQPLPTPNYDEEVDFQALAMTDPNFAKFYDDAHGHVNFQDPKALQQLTKSVLKRDFNLELELPDDRLCPPVPVRYNYVRWLQELLDSTDDSEDLEKKDIIGLDIGIGASCIYSLLACSLRPTWKMLGTDIDPSNFKNASDNIKRNNLESRISTKLNVAEDALINPKAFGVDKLDFTMCNPPFYSSPEDMAVSSAGKSDAPSAVCTGADVEMICEGGDAGFVLRMVEESIELGNTVRWYTSMLGKLSSVHQVIDRLKEIGVTNWAVTLLRAGNKTRRWAVGWSFGDRRPSNAIARGSDVGTHILPYPTAQTIHTIGFTRSEAADLLNDTLKQLDLQWSWNAEEWVGHGVASQNVWSRSARRKRKRVEMEQEDGQESKPEPEAPKKKESADVALKFDIEVKEGDMEVRWRQGKDNILFESFCGMLKRAMKQK